MNAISYDERRAVYAKALAAYGAEAQTRMAIEEMSELTKELCKIGRGKRDMDALADEIADVTIMMEQLRMIYGINELVCEHMDAKVDRLNDRLERAQRLTLDELRTMEAPVWCKCELLDGGDGYWCLCQKGMITAPSGFVYDVDEIQHWVFYSHKPS